MAMEDAGNEKHRRVWRFAPLAAITLVLAAGYLLGWHRHVSLTALAESSEALKAYVAAHPVLAPALFVSVYVLAVATAFPAASLLTVTGGFLFGWLLGGALVVVAATTGATLLFLAARTALGDLLKRRTDGRLARLARGFEEGAFGYLLVLRLAPVFPFWMVNIAPAFFDVRLRTYVGATALGIIPGTFAYAWLGRGLDSVLAAAARSGEDLEIGDLVTAELTIALAALAAVTALAVVVKRMRGVRAP